MNPSWLKRVMGRVVRVWVWLACGVGVGVGVAGAQPFEVGFDRPSMDRWMYPHNATPGQRPTAPVFGTLGDESGVDSRHGQFLVGFELEGRVPTGLDLGRYRILGCRLSLTVSRDLAYVLDDTEDPVGSYLEAGLPGAVADPDPGRPVELFGVGYRNGFTEETFREDSPFGRADTGQRNAYAAGYGVDGVLVDVGNNVGKTNELFPSFVARPFAVGRVEGLAAGETVLGGTVMRFELNLADPLVEAYVRRACRSGRLRWMVTSLQTSGFGGTPAWAEFHTRDSVLGDAPRMVLSGVVFGEEDTDGDGLPDDWERHYLGGLGGGGDGDSDGDGASDAEEYAAGTDPGDRGDVLVMGVERAEDGDGVRVRFRHAPGRRYGLEASADLREWSLVAGVEAVYEVGTAWAGFRVPGGVVAGFPFLRVRVEVGGVAAP